MRRRMVLLAAIGLLAAAAPATAVIDANSCGPDRCILKVTRSVPHATYWTQAFDTTQTTDLLAGSWLNTTAWYVSPDFQNPPFDEEPASEAGVMMWLEWVSVATSGGGTFTFDEPRILLGVTTWVEGGQVHAYVRSETGATVDADLVHVGEKDTFAGVRVSVLLGGTTTVSVDSSGSPPQVDTSQTFATLPKGTYRWVIMAPEATQINNQVVLFSDEALATTAGRQTTGDTGVLYSYEDWEATLAFRTSTAELLVDGGASYTVADDLYGYFGPATGGIASYYVVSGGSSLGNWGESVFDVTAPNGDTWQRQMSYPVCTGTTCPGGPSGTTPLIFNHGPAGTWDFHIDRHEAVGLTPDMIGILADIDPAT